MKKPAWFIFSLLLIISCLDQPDCFRLNNNVVGIAFKVMGSGNADTVALEGVQLSGTDSVFFSYKLVTGLGLPLNYTVEETEVLFNSPGETRRMLLGYRVGTQFVSEDCGERYILSNLNVLEHDFDSVRVVNDTPGKTASTNIEVYRCPVTNIMDVVFRQLTVTSAGVVSSQIVAVYLNNVTPDFTGAPLYENTRTASTYLPVNLAASNTVYTFDQADDGIHQLSIGYTLNTLTRYTPCGEQTFVSKMVFSSDFDSVSFALDSDGNERRAITDPPQPMIQVYRCPVTNLAGVNFKRKSNTKIVQDTVVLKDLQVDFATPVLYPNDTLRSVNVPLNPATNTTLITFKFDTGETKTMTVSYTRTTKNFFDKACGNESQIFFTGLKVESTDFDSVSVKNASLANLPIINLEIIKK